MRSRRRAICTVTLIQLIFSAQSQIFFTSGTQAHPPAHFSPEAVEPNRSVEGLTIRRPQQRLFAARPRLPPTPYPPEAWPPFSFCCAARPPGGAGGGHQGASDKTATAAQKGGAACRAGFVNRDA